jgi:hypothetical protein
MQHQENALPKESRNLHVQGNFSQAAPGPQRALARLGYHGVVGAFRAFAFLCMITTRRVLLKSERLCKLSSTVRYARTK